MTEPIEERTPAEERAALQDLEELVLANHESNATMIQLVETVRDETRARGRKVDALERNQRQLRGLSILGTVAVVALLVMAVFNAVSIQVTRQNAERSAVISRNVDQTNSLLLDCLNSTGKCGQLNAQQQANLLNKVKQYELTGFYCARTNPLAVDPDGKNFLACMEKLYPGGPTLNLG